MKPGISYSTYYVPDSTLTVQEIVSACKAEHLPSACRDAQDYQKHATTVLGVNTVRVEDRLSEAEMIGLALERLFDEFDVVPEDIDYLLLAQETRPRQMRNLPQFLQYRYGMARAFVTTVSGNHCANVDSALSLASSFFSDPKVRKVAIVSSIKMDHPADRIIGTYGVLGDAAGVIVIDREALRFELVDAVKYCVGMLFETDLNAPNALVHSKYNMRCISDLISRNTLAPPSINQVIIQNANPTLILQCLHAANISKESVFLHNLGKYGHLDSVDIIANLTDVWNQKLPVNANIITFGSGWAGTYISQFLRSHS